MTTFIDSLRKHLNYTETHNGAITNLSSLSRCVDLFAQGGSIRSWSDYDILGLFVKAFEENNIYAVRLIYMFRDIREGQGQRRPFRIQLKWLANNYPEQTKAILSLVPEYGRWDDLYSVIGTPCQEHMFSIIKKQLQEDMDNCSKKLPVSLLGKWLKRINTSSEESKKIAQLTRKYLKFSNKDYRRMCTILNNHINVAENLMSAKKWNEIEYNKVPSQCFIKNNRCFARNDNDRYLAYIENVKEGKEKINAKTLYPYQIVEKVFSCTLTEDESDILWKNLADFSVDSNAIVVADVSGSMNGLPLNVCISLALYFSERAKGPYHNKFITFSARPELVEVCGNTISDKIHMMSQAQWDMNTNLEKVFDKILSAAVSTKMDPELMVDKLYIVSDMEFDSISNVKSDVVETFYETIKERFSSAGYTIPKLIFWNVNARVGNFPVVSSTPNTCMISGFSPSILQYLNKDEIPSAESIMLDVLNSPRYSVIDF